MIGNKYMSGKFKYILALLVVCLMSTTMASAGAYQISKLELTHQKDFTVLTIPGTVGMQVSHQVVAAKDGKPNRIVIDCLNARHNLSAKKFSNLPSSVITGIRTAQFATQPEEVVRVVLDLKKEAIYRVESDNGAIKLFVSDPDARPFALWSAPQISTKTEKSVRATEKQKVAKVTPIVKKPITSDNKVVNQKQSKPVTVASIIPHGSPKIAKVEAEAVDDYKKPVPIQFKLNNAKAKVVVKKPTPTLTKIDKSDVRSEIKISKPVIPKEKQVVKKQAVKTLVASKPVPIVVVKKQAEKPLAVSKPVPTVVAKKKAVKSSVVSKPVPTVVAQKQDKGKAQVEKPKARAKAKPSQPTVAKVETPKKSKPRVDLAARAKEKAIVFSSSKVGPYPPAPGVVPPGSATPQKDVHQLTPAEQLRLKGEKKPKPSGEAKPQPKKIVLTPPPSPKKSAPVTVASVDKSESKKLSSVRNKASKYRRDAAKNARLRQAHVVQFPQRLVIKYNTGSMRDPFETLIDLGNGNLGGIEVNRIPNIEVLSLVGIIEAPNRKGAALMEDHEGIGYILKPGDRVRNGYVAQVDKKAVYFHINEYGWTRTVAKYMKKDK